jgi:hypothetical protein
MLVDALTYDRTEVADTMKAAAALDGVRPHKLSLRRGAELLQIPYRAFLELIAAHRVPSIDCEAGWLDREQQLFAGKRYPHDAGCLRERFLHPQDDSPSDDSLSH